MLIIFSMIILPIWRYIHERNELKKKYKKYLEAAQIMTVTNEIKWRATEDTVDELENSPNDKHFSHNDILEISSIFDENDLL